MVAVKNLVAIPSEAGLRLQVGRVLCAMARDTLSRRNPLRSGSPTARMGLWSAFAVAQYYCRNPLRSGSPTASLSERPGCSGRRLRSGRNPLRSGSPTASPPAPLEGLGEEGPVAIPSEAGLRLQALGIDVSSLVEGFKSQSPQKRVSDCKPSMWFPCQPPRRPGRNPLRSGSPTARLL